MEQPIPLDPTILRLRDGFERISLVLRADLWTTASRAGLNPAQAQVLRLLANRPAGLRPKEIAAHLGVSGPSIADTLAALGRKGMISREADPADARGAQVRATAEGARIGGSFLATGADLAAALEKLPPEAREQLLLAQIQVIRNLQLAGVIPLQRMCVSCVHFRPDAHPGAGHPHHCAFVDAAIGNRDLRLDCGDHEAADPATQAATWAAFAKGMPSLQAQP